MTKLNRRRFLAQTGKSVSVIAAAGALPPLMAEASSVVLNTEERLAKTLLAIIRHMFPHKQLGDHCYTPIVDALLDDAAKDQALAEKIADGIKELDSPTNRTWLDLTEAEQVEALVRIEDGSFFKMLHSRAVWTLYNNHEVWEALGYEGPSFSKGGYLARGFNDLDWLPNPFDG